MKTKITYNGQTLEFDKPYEARQFIEKERAKPTISITIDNEETNVSETKTFGDFGYGTISWLEHKIYEENQAYRKARANDMYKQDPNPTAIWSIRFILENKFGIWVAKSKTNKYNLRKRDKYSWEPFVFAKKEMFGLTGDELKRFYTRYMKTVALIG